MFNVLTEKTKQHKEIFGGDGYVQYLGHGIGIIDTYVQTHQDIYIKLVQFFVNQLYLNKGKKKKPQQKFTVLTIFKSS